MRDPVGHPRNAEMRGVENGSLWGKHCSLEARHKLCLTAAAALLGQVSELVYDDTSPQGRTFFVSGPGKPGRKYWPGCPDSGLIV